ncbi:hypothetical protein [Amycolatopsis sp. NPDC059657]|uniref:hypothetical protein n=1 Tax=Amycolatopsis sp. NPDC059657 TaxID=3346899 RepID=UPI003672B420
MSTAHQVSKMLDQWEQLIEFVEDSYHDNIDEYRYDISVRTALENSVLLPDAPAWTREKLAELDARFQALLLPGRVDDDPAVPWWYARIPRYAGRQLADAFEVWYQVSVEIR